ncbi:MAG: twin-arginine translocase TatA/TatE family subunit [Candidatus Eisenbacteria bacterium]
MGLGGIGIQELLLIFLLVLLLFGAKRLPEVGKSLGRGIREFKKATKEITSDADLEEYEKKPPRKPAEEKEEKRAEEKDAEEPKG